MSALIFPLSLAGITIAVGREPIHDTKVVTTLSGKEQRTTWSTYPRYRYTLTVEFLRAGASYLEFQKIFGFLVRHLGSFDSFLFQDPEDQTVTAHPFGVGNASITDFQLQRTLVASADLAAPASRSYWTTSGDGYEPIFELNGSPNIYKDTGGGPVLQTITTNYTLPGNGIVHFTAAPAAGAILTWDGNYYRRVRFEHDNLPAERIVQSFWKTGLSLLSVK